MNYLNITTGFIPAPHARLTIVIEAWKGTDAFPKGGRTANC